MKVVIKSIQFKADKKLKIFIEEKLQKLSQKNDLIMGADVILRVENAENDENKVAEIKILIKNQNVFAKKQTKSFEEAVDMCIEAIKKQLVKLKEKQTERK